ncbi:ribonuclease-like 3 [Rhinichthys klamathensis goyatoka]|uniref:ribonuclease-like 3 n=1 Tax=Rhinichthys klamathensis goyatoka TaxID=3034132 RepID=UPI0024B482DE|nr:ribonuclease-like 3 [Rhinichthys klamathensis goyatoka]XP_056109150.1 ribonuclease-like 3 [Rhinichthys klamathensis goyatoka]
MEIHQSAVILLLVVCVSFSTHAQPDGYEKFLKQHVFGAMTVQKCDSEIRIRGIVRPQTTNGCKETNTFILANKKYVRAVCGKAGTALGDDKFMSNNPFPVVICKKNSGDTHPHCKYRGVRSTRKIVVSCEDGWPTHYAEDVINV